MQAYRDAQVAGGGSACRRIRHLLQGQGPLRPTGIQEGCIRAEGLQIKQVIFSEMLLLVSSELLSGGTDNCIDPYNGNRVTRIPR